jgi:hypothetical protein
MALDPITLPTVVPPGQPGSIPMPTPQEQADAKEAQEAYQHYLQAFKEQNPDPDEGMLSKAGNVISTAYKAEQVPAGGVREAIFGKILGQQRPGDQAYGAPSSEEYLTRMGWKGNGGSASDLLPGYFSEKGQGKHWYSPEVGGALDVTGKGVVGGAIDQVTDPVNYLALGLSSAVKGSGVAAELLSKLLLANPEGGLTAGGKILHGALNPIEAASQGAGRGIYNSAFDKADRAMTNEYGDKIGSISDTLNKNNVWGTADSVLKQTQDIHSGLGETLGNQRRIAGVIFQK